MNLVALLLLAVAVAVIVALLAARRRLVPAPPQTDEHDQLDSIANIAPAIVWITDADKSCTFVNDQWLRFSGRTREEELGFRWLSGLHADDIPRCMPIYEAGFEARQPVEIEYRQRRHDGQFRWML